MLQTVRHQGPNNTLIWRVLEEDLPAGVTLHVRENEEAIAVNDDEIIKTFPCGDYQSGSDAEEFVHSTLYFINKGLLVTIVWGTGEPVILMDAEYKTELPVRLDGELNIRVADSAALFAKFKDSFECFDQNIFNRQIRSVLMTVVRQHLNEQMAENGISLLNIQSFLNEIAAELRKFVAAELEGYGLETVGFCINQIIVPTDNPVYLQMKKKAEEKKMVKAEPSGVVCPSCGVMLPAEARFCGYCGCKIENRCADCGSILLPGAKFCVKCGKKVVSD